MKRFLRQLGNRWKSLLRLDAKRDDLDAEIAHHLELLTEEFEREGLSPTEARRAARARFGGVEHLKADCRENWGVLWLEALARDVKFALRQMVKSPGFTIVVAFTLALGIGACATIMSVMQATILKPLPVKDQESLFVLRENNQELGIESFSLSLPNFADFRDRIQGVDGLFAIRGFSATLVEDGEPARVEGHEFTAGHMETLGWTPVIGRGFRAEEDQPGAPRVAMISESLWRNRYDGAQSIVGKPMIINSEPHEVVGVFGDETLLFGKDVHVWRPMSAASELEERDNHVVTVCGRLAPGNSEQQAEAEIASIAATLASSYPESNAGWGAHLEPLYNEIVARDLRRGVFLLFAAVVMLLLIACANVANLLLARSIARQTEISMRFALGASRGRIVQQLLSESALYCVLGTVGGVVISSWSVILIRAFASQGLPRAESISVDLGSLAFAALACAVATVLSGLVPALRASRANSSVSLGGGTRVVGGVPSKERIRSSLVVAQLALSLCLLAGAGLLLKSFLRIQNIDPGYNTSNVFTFRISPAGAEYGEEASRTAFYRNLIDGIQALPGVTSAGMTSAVPLGPGRTGLNVFSVDPSAIDPEDSIQASWRIVSPDYFNTMEIPLIEGRSISRFDTTDRESVVILSRELAQQFWPGESALGKRVNPGGGENYYTVVGVVGDARMNRLTGDPDFTMYFSSWQWWGWDTMTFVVRSDQPQGGLGAAIRSVVNDLDSKQPIFALESMEAYVDAEMQTPRLNSWLLGIFAAVALILASVGVYGVVAANVSQRQNEIGVRIALGARRIQIRSMIMKQGLWLLGLGLGLGSLASWQFSVLMRSQLFRVEASDLAVHFAVAGALAGAAIIATLVPVGRAVRLDPMKALRME